MGLNVGPKGQIPRSPLLKLEYFEIVLVFGLSLKLGVMDVYECWYKDN